MNSKGLVLLLAAAVAACGSARGGAEPARDGRSNAEIEALFQARADSALMRFSEADVAFMNGMIAHHAQALVMAELTETRASSNAVRTLAARIDNAQKDEIATMQRWLADRGQPVPEVGPDGAMPGGHGGHGAHGGHAMPGMLTPAQLDTLAAARGMAFDSLFLTYMIRHHQGAVTMVHALLATDGALQDDSVFRIASDIQVDQKTEIARMELLLEELSGGETPLR